ncbi:metalloprotease mig-17-like [Biomphalaria glabrata]|uniref:Metalloprotease mig-17-like n=1 Tax=Biomphalaria glabrata TaxID=6526 RepID=A0A9W3BFD9_BIOGL|nr:metalloprotease mig-17-like [Biomphalaria glabrata]
MSSLSTYGINIEIRLKKLDILNTNLFPAVSIEYGNGIDRDVALSSFDYWLAAHNSHNNLKYDFAFLWTGYDLYGDSDDFVAGYAHTGAVCKPWIASGVGEFNMTYMTAIVTAHEIGHILGANHDGPESSNVMAAISRQSAINRWYFSSLSATAIKNYTSSLTSNCLLTTDPASTKPTVTYGAYTGHILDPNAVCQRALNNSNSYMCLEWPFYNHQSPSGDRVCVKIYCKKPGTNLCYEAFASDGMVCDTNKRCKKGKCMPDSTAPHNLDSSCVFGDQKRLEFTNFKGTCHEHISLDSSAYCYDAVVVQSCCNSCKAHYTGRAGCEYGDSVLGCNKSPREQMCPNNMDTCCEYCKGFVSSVVG